VSRHKIQIIRCQGEVCHPPISSIMERVTVPRLVPATGASVHVGVAIPPPQDNHGSNSVRNKTLQSSQRNISRWRLEGELASRTRSPAVAQRTLSCRRDTTWHRPHAARYSTDSCSIVVTPQRQRESNL